MYKLFKNLLILLAGVFFIAMGILGLVLPFLQGFLFLAIGLLILSVLSPTLRTWFLERTKPYPTLHKVAEKASTWVGKNIG